MHQQSTPILSRNATERYLEPLNPPPPLPPNCLIPFPSSARQLARPGRLDVRGGSPLDDSADDGVAYETDPTQFLFLCAGIGLNVYAFVC
jgi:hypothetical protein